MTTSSFSLAGASDVPASDVPQGYPVSVFGDAGGSVGAGGDAGCADRSGLLTARQAGAWCEHVVSTSWSVDSDAQMVVDAVLAYAQVSGLLAASVAELLGAFVGPDPVEGGADQHFDDQHCRDGVAVMLGVGRGRAARMIAHARALSFRMPGTRAGLAAGQLTVGQVDILVDLCDPVPGASIPALEREVLPKIVGRSLRYTRKVVAYAIAQRCPDLPHPGVPHPKQERQRSTGVVNNGDGTATITVVCPVDEAAVIHGALTAQAKQALAQQKNAADQARKNNDQNPDTSHSPSDGDSHGDGEVPADGAAPGDGEAPGDGVGEHAGAGVGAGSASGGSGGAGAGRGSGAGLRGGGQDREGDVPDQTNRDQPNRDVPAGDAPHGGVTGGGVSSGGVSWGMGAWWVLADADADADGLASVRRRSRPVGVSGGWLSAVGSVPVVESTRSALLLGWTTVETGHCPGRSRCHCTPPADGVDAMRVHVLHAWALRMLADPALPVVHGRRRVEVQVVMDVQTLLGMVDNPCEIAGFGLVPAGVGRVLAGEQGVGWRRLVTDPVSGHLLDYGRTVYAPPQVLRDFVRARDRGCTHPGCVSRLDADVDVDHVRGWAQGGVTAAENLQVLCARHHEGKTRGVWSCVVDADGTVWWTAPTGHTVAGGPSPVLGFGASVPVSDPGGIVVEEEVPF